MVYQYGNHTVPWYISVWPSVNHLIAFKEPFQECRKWKFCLKNIYKCNCFCWGSILLFVIYSHIWSTHRSVYESVVKAERSKYQQNSSVWSLMISTIWRSEGACSSTANNRCLRPYRKCIMANSLQSDKLISSGNICVNMSHTVRPVKLQSSDRNLWETWRFSFKSFLVSGKFVVWSF